jgi:hypothetical protein
MAPIFMRMSMDFRDDQDSGQPAISRKHDVPLSSISLRGERGGKRSMGAIPTPDI